MSNHNLYQIDDKNFISIVNSSSNIRQALIALKLAPKGGNYGVFRNRCSKLGLEPSYLSTWGGASQKRAATTKEQIISSCTKSFSRQASLRALGLTPSGANIRWIDNKIKELSIDISHWLGQAHLRGKTHNWSKKIPLKDILVKNSTYSSIETLKKRLIKANLIQNECAQCGINSWDGQELSLHLDHIDGNNRNHTLENIRLLCPNCHSLTPTYCGKNKGKKH